MMVVKVSFMKIKIFFIFVFLTSPSLFGSALDCDKKKCTDHEDFQYTELICFNVCKIAKERNLLPNTDFMTCEINSVNLAKEMSILTRIDMKDLRTTSDRMYDSISKIDDYELLGGYKKCSTQKRNLPIKNKKTLF